MYIATYNGNKEVVEILLKAKADTEIGYQKATPLHVAALHGHEEIVELLLRYGANPDKKDQHGKTSYNLAEAQRHENVVKLLTLKPGS